jgi:hypothetical protein
MPRTADLRGSSSCGGRAVAAAVALHHPVDVLMLGWGSDKGTSVSATDRLRAAEAEPIETGLREDRLHVVDQYIGAYPEDEEERSRCARRFHAPAPTRSSH